LSRHRGRKSRTSASANRPVGPFGSCLPLVDPHFQPGTRPACSIHFCSSGPCFLQGRQLDVTTPIRCSKRRRRVEVRPAQEDDVHGDGVGRHLDDPPEFWHTVERVLPLHGVSEPRDRLADRFVQALDDGMHIWHHAPGDPVRDLGVTVGRHRWRSGRDGLALLPQPISLGPQSGGRPRSDGHADFPLVPERIDDPTEPPAVLVLHCRGFARPSRDGHAEDRVGVLDHQKGSSRRTIDVTRSAIMEQGFRIERGPPGG
jgi:hypothetical protein